MDFLDKITQKYSHLFHRTKYDIGQTVYIWYDPLSYETVPEDGFVEFVVVDNRIIDYNRVRSIIVRPKEYNAVQGFDSRSYQSIKPLYRIHESRIDFYNSKIEGLQEEIKHKEKEIAHWQKLKDYANEKNS